MIIELDTTEFSWLSEFLCNYLYTDPGRTLPEKQKERMASIINTTKEKSNFYLVDLDDVDLSMMSDLLEYNTCCCPGCNTKSVKCRKSILKMINQLMETIE